MHEQDLLRIDGWGVLSRRHARQEAYERFTLIANAIKAGKNPPESYIELATAFVTALKAPAWEAYQEPVTHTD